MMDEIIYNQIISFNNDSIISHTVKKSFAEKSELTMICDDWKKIVIKVKSVEVAGNKKRIRELVSMAKERGFNIPKKSVKHYAKDDEGIEYILIRW